jgi:SSS family solute:Na+ symporter
MSISVAIVILFLLLNALFAMDWRSALKRRSIQGPAAAKTAGNSAEYVLAGRTLAGPALLATLAASNLSAFTIFGVSGASYRLGWAFFPVMAFGTAYMAFSFAAIGLPLRRLSAVHGWTTPGEFVAARFVSPALGRLFSGLSLAYTIPYLAVQTGAGGRLLSGLTGLPTAAGSAMLIGLVTAYVYKGGMRSVVRTDLVQLGALIVLALAAGAIVLSAAGSSGAFHTIDMDTPRMSRAGTGSTLGWLPLLGYYVLWGLADPMFPHFIQRFYAARSDRALLSGMVAYPAVAVLVFLPVCAIGVIGSALVPGLEGNVSDGIFTILTKMLAGPVWGPVFSVAALAALMSTMDSQLLSCASMIGTDFLPARWRGNPADAAAGRARNTGANAVIALLLGAGAWLVSLYPPASILDFLGRTAFPGYASLAPVAIAGIYAPWLGKRTAGLALLTGTMLVTLQSAGLFALPLPAALFNLGIQSFVLGIGALAASAGPGSRIKADRSRVHPGDFGRGGARGGSRTAALAAVAGMGILGVDFWQYGPARSLAAGLPWWVLYHSGLTLSLSLVFWWYARTLVSAQRLETGVSF